MGIISLAPFPFMVKVGLSKRVASIFARKFISAKDDSGV